MSFDISKPYTTRNGREAWAVLVPHRESSAPMLLGYYVEDGIRCHVWWQPDGKALKYSSDFDLVNVPETRTVKMWAVLNHDGSCEGYEVRQHPHDLMLAQRELELTFTIGEGLDP